MSGGSAVRRPPEQNPAYGPWELVFLKRGVESTEQGEGDTENKIGCGQGVSLPNVKKTISTPLLLHAPYSSLLMNYWLMKSEPDVFGLADLQKKGTAPWDGVRNYQARNFMRAMQVGDQVLFYHSSCEIPGVAGVMEIASPARPDETQFDPKSEFYDAGAKRDNPRWSLVEVRYVATFPKFVPLETLRSQPALKQMRLLAPGNRLSVLPITPAEFKAIGKLGGYKESK